ncbi:MAG: hypothetical protein Q8K92_08265 [Leadbetterella sp.]|nr:hypothetical protein [Leadbetterella sp.]
MAESVSLAGITAGLNDYALNHKVEIVNQVMEIGFGGAPNSPIKPLSDYVNIFPADGEIVLSDLLTVDPLQPGNKGSFDPKAYATFKTRKAKPEPVKVDLLFGEQKIRTMYNTYMARVAMKKYDPEVVPFEEWLIAKLNNDVQYYLRTGMYKAALDANGTDSLDLFDGYVEQITDTIANAPATINVVNMAAWTIDNAVTEAEKMADALPSKIAFQEGTVMVMTKAAKTLYQKAFRKAYPSLPYNDGFGKTFLEGTNVEMIIEEGVGTFARPFITTRDNLVAMYDESRIGDIAFDYQKRDRSMAFLMDFDFGVGICATELLYVGAFV